MPRGVKEGKVGADRIAAVRSFADGAPGRWRGQRRGLSQASACARSDRLASRPMDEAAGEEVGGLSGSYVVTLRREDTSNAGRHLSTSEDSYLAWNRMERLHQSA